LSADADDYGRKSQKRRGTLRTQDPEAQQLLQAEFKKQLDRQEFIHVVNKKHPWESLPAESRRVLYRYVQ
jgi:hypothetical protein